MKNMKMGLRDLKVSVRSFNICIFKVSKIKKRENEESRIFKEVKTEIFLEWKIHIDSQSEGAHNF